TAVPLDSLFIADLTNWGPPALPTGTDVRVDPVLGRVAVSAARKVLRLAVSWSVAFSGDVGAGTYPREIHYSRVQFAVPVDAPKRSAAAASAWAGWQAAPAAPTGRITVADSHRYAEPLLLKVAQGSRLGIVAAEGARPCITGTIDIRGTGAGDVPGGVVLDG